MDFDTFNILLQIVGPFIIGALGAIGWLRFFHKKERRLFKNIERPVSLVGTTARSMQHEAEFLKRSGLFQVRDPQSDPRAIDHLTGARLVVVGYSPTMTNLKDIIDVARGKDMPVLIYAGPREITDDHMAILQSYTNHSMCNTPLRLISDVFSVMSTYPEDK